MTERQNTEQVEELAGGEFRISERVLELEEVFDALAHSRRRYLLASLVEDRAEMAVSELAAQIVAREGDVPAADVADERVESVVVSLSHCHLPHLESLEILAYSVEDETVRATNTDQVRAVLAGASAVLDDCR